jgi:hypothetical protein
MTVSSRQLEAVGADRDQHQRPVNIYAIRGTEHRQNDPRVNRMTYEFATPAQPAISSSYKMPGINAFTRRRYSGYSSGKVSIINFSSTRIFSQ